MSERIQVEQIVPVEAGIDRLDRMAALVFPEFSRSRLQQWIASGELTVDGRSWRARYKVKGGERLRIDAQQAVLTAEPESMALDVVYEDEALIVVNKPANLVVHPGAGHATGTLMNGLLGLAPELGALPRAGIVHRLDQHTTGLMVVARTDLARNRLVRALAERDIARIYDGIVTGLVDKEGSVDAAIGRHPVARTRMTIRRDGKSAVTRYSVVERFRYHTRLRLALETGRTHQIRVHMQHIGFPMLGDPVYGGGSRVRLDGPVQQVVQGFMRQALHACELSLEHPMTGDAMRWRAPLHDDMLDLRDRLAADADL
jgi:23S rRNA pseudouridine1911/1915/1917 synthase